MTTLASQKIDSVGSDRAAVLDSRIGNVVTGLDNWIEQYGYAGWDPYDIKGEPFYVNLLRSDEGLPRKALRKIIFTAIENYPFTSRRILGIEPRVNAKAMALLALAYLKLHLLTDRGEFLTKHDYCIDWLLSNNHCSHDSYLGWGYPFDWQSLVFIPRNTPLCVPTVLAGHALLDRLEYLDDQSHDVDLNRIKAFLIDGLNKAYFPENDSVCFSYSPVDDFQVINANLYTASFLTRYGVVFNDQLCLEIGRKARRFSLAQQDNSGSWPYWASTNSVPMARHVDNYHTGIILQWLRVIADYDPDSDDIRRPLALGCDYYRANLFTADGIPKFSDRKVYPVDIHGAAQALVTFNYICEDVDPGLVKAVCEFTLSNMYDANGGYFYYRMLSPRRLVKIPYLRWSQAWMLYGLVNMLEHQGRTS
ncbi:MAG: hypothetical protein JSU74_07650 [Candidatus Zixiibacteriota bacterium]|nr:MAG: hypothetical protein JSU74_07650 [candidate division Zixibacteria bacterium]